MATSTKNLRLLSLDGGGVRGLSTLLVLQRIFFVLDQKLDSSWKRPLKPCQVFDIIAGTSTGGLIAIMLGTLSMTVDQCIQEYLELAPKIFPEQGFVAGSKTLKLFNGLHGTAPFDATTLEKEMKKLIEKYLPHDPELALEDVPLSNDTCRVVVCSTYRGVNRPVRLRSYKSTWEPSTHCKIWQAARATSAAPLFFDPITFGIPPMTYGDGGLHYNNPIRVLMDESKQIWDCSTGRRAGHIVSIGTGKQSLNKVGNDFIEIIKSLETIVVDTEKTAEMFANEIADLSPLDRPDYFRFNVDQGLENIGLEEWKQFDRLTEASSTHLGAHRRDIEACADALSKLMVGTLKSASRGLILCDLPSKTDRFFGRATELSAMKRQLDATCNGRKGIVLRGISGSGKTQMALEYISQVQGNYSAVLWINATSKMSVEQSFASCANRICVKYPSFRDHAKHSEPRFVVGNWLQTPIHRHWLLVIDSMDDLIQNKPLLDFVRVLDLGAICITSTHPGVSRALGVSLIELGRLDWAASQSLLLWRALETDQDLGEDDRESARAAVKLLDGLPLAVELAGILIHEGIVSLKALPTTFEANYQSLTEYTPDPGHWFWDKSTSLFGMFDTLYKSLLTKHTCAALLLSFCSVYGPWQVPISLLRNLELFEMASYSQEHNDFMRLKTFARNEVMFNVAIDQLHRVFLAKRKQNSDGSISSISLHGSICRWRIATMGDSRIEWVMQASYGLARHLRYCYEKETVLTKFLDTARLFLYPSDRCIHAIQQHVPAHELAPPDGKYAAQYSTICSSIAQIYLAVGHFKTSERLFSSALEYISITQRDHESDHQDFFQLLRGLAISCQKTGELARAEEALQSASKIVESLHGHTSDEAVEIATQLKTVKHKITLEQGHRKRALIASTGGKLHDRGHVSGVLDSTGLSDVNTTLYLHESIDRLQIESLNVLDPEDPDTLTTMESLAVVLGSQGKYEAAEKVYRQALELKEKVLGHKHSDTLTSMDNLALVLGSQGKYEATEEMHRQALELNKKVLGLKHPKTLASMNNLAVVLGSQGKYKAAEEMHRQALELNKKVLGLKHPKTLASMNNLAVVLGSQGKYETAEEMHRQALELKERVLGLKHLDTLASMENLAVVLKSQGKYSAAEEMHRQALELREKVLGPKHLDTLASMDNLALVLGSQGKYSAAEEMHRQALELREKVLGPKHLDTLASMDNLALVLGSQGKYSAAEEMHWQALELREKVLGPKHLDTLASMDNLAKVLESQRNNQSPYPPL